MTELRFRRAMISDLPAIIALLKDDILGASREPTGPAAESRYREAFREIDADANQFLVIAEEAGQVVGTLQLTFIPGLARGAMRRGQVEAVRVARERRGENVGKAMLEWAIAKCAEEGCGVVQLTTDKARPDAHRFYEQLGFEASHVGYKRML